MSDAYGYQFVRDGRVTQLEELDVTALREELIAAMDALEDLGEKLGEMTRLIERFREGSPPRPSAAGAGVPPTA